jgi:hypothetical protein
LRETIFLSILCFCFVTACSTGNFVRDDLRQKIGVQTPVYQEGDIDKAFSKKVNLPKPFSVAVYFKSTHARDGWRWTMEDKRRVIKNIRDNVSEEYISKIFLMNDSVTLAPRDISSDTEIPRQDELRSLRLAAAQYQADALLVVDGIGAVARKTNEWTASYFLIAPMFFVNGSKANSYFAINASLWDVRNEVLYASLNAEGEMNQNYPFALAEDDSLYYEKSKQLALTDLERSMKEDFKLYR